MKPDRYKLLLLGMMAVALAVLSACRDSDAETRVDIWLTMPDKSRLLEQVESVSFRSGKPEHSEVIQVDDAIRYQQMDGFGAALTDSSAWLLANALDDERRDKLMKLLFDREEGIGFSYLRLPMGASDFALQRYTYDDMPQGETDPELEHFSIEHDRQYIIPLLKQALSLNPDLKIMASPWSPPGWMKTSDSLVGGSLKPEAYEPFARYFVKFIQAYEAEGIPIDAVTLQNEPHHVPSDYPGMRMEAWEQALLIKEYLGPAFEENGIGTKIVIWDHNWDEYYYPLSVLGDADANPYIAGTAFHGYAGDVSSQSRVKEAYPDKDIYFTESSGGEWSTDFGSNLKWDLQNLIIGSTRHWAKTVLKWNLALDEQHGPYLGGCRDCRGIVTIDRQTGDVVLNEEYYAFGHASKFVKPGAFRMESASSGSGDIETVAFINPDDSLVLIALNASEDMKEIQVSWRDQSFATSLQAGAAATMVWNLREE